MFALIMGFLGLGLLASVLGVVYVMYDDQQGRYRALGFERAGRQLGLEAERADALALRRDGPDHALHGELGGAPVVVQLWGARKATAALPWLNGAFAQGGLNPTMYTVQVRSALLLDPALHIKPLAQPHRRLSDVLAEGPPAHVAGFGAQAGLSGPLSALIEALFPNARPLHERLFVFGARLILLYVDRGVVLMVFANHTEDPKTCEREVVRQLSHAQDLTRALVWPPAERREAHLLQLADAQRGSPWRGHLLREAARRSDDPDALIDRWLDADDLEAVVAAHAVDDDLLATPQRRARAADLIARKLGEADALDDDLLAMLEQLRETAALPHLLAHLERGGLPRATTTRARQLVAQLQEIAAQAPERGGLSLSAGERAGGLSLTHTPPGALSLRDDEDR